jgi:hypothetical protein
VSEDGVCEQKIKLSPEQAQIEVSVIAECGPPLFKRCFIQIMSDPISKDVAIWLNAEIISGLEVTDKKLACT